MGDHEFARSSLHTGLLAGHASLAALGTDEMQGYAHAAVRKGPCPCCIYVESRGFVFGVGSSAVCNQSLAPFGVRISLLRPVLDVSIELLAGEMGPCTAPVADASTAEKKVLM